MTLYRLPAGAFFALKDGRIARVTTFYNLNDWIENSVTMPNCQNTPPGQELPCSLLSQLRGVRRSLPEARILSKQVDNISLLTRPASKARQS